MHLLVVSKGFMAGKTASQKAPGIALAEKLERLELFKLLDLPSNLNGLDFFESLNALLVASKTIIKYSITHKNDEFFFYNFPKAYIYFYFVLKIFGCKTSLFMADGENCFGLKKYPRLFIKLFTRVVHLHYAREDRYREFGKHAYWFPGILNRREVANFQAASEKPSTILYNSSLKGSNHPHLLVEIANANPGIQFYCTSTFKDYKDRGFILSSRVPQNIKFIGELSGEDYKRLLQEIEGILLVRDESRFENMYNFPSKLIEALAHGKTVFSIYEISGVPRNLYVNCKGKLDLSTAFSAHLEDASVVDFFPFIEACDVKNFGAWLNSKNNKNSI